MIDVVGPSVGSIALTVVLPADAQDSDGKYVANVRMTDPNGVSLR